MYRWPKPKRLSGSFFQAAVSLDEVMAFYEARPDSFDGLAEGTRYLDGRCYVCQQDVRFGVGKLETDERINWRETLVCPECGLSNRQRSSIHIFETLVQPDEDDSLYVTEGVTPLFYKLFARHRKMWSSEYSSKVEQGELFETPHGRVQNQDVTALTYLDRKFHAVLSFDVLEHVPDYRQALREFHRVLASGGQLILSVPFLFGEETRVRARLDETGKVEHLYEPLYHGDPVSEAGVLCFYEFGMDLLVEMKAAGFKDNFVVCYHAPELGYITPQVIFIGRKRN